MRIAIGSDHAGYRLKELLRSWLAEQGHEVTDLGATSEDSVDYPHYGGLVAQAVASGVVDRGVAVCGSGQGICMAVNKVPGARGGVVRDRLEAELIRRHNDANVICFGGRLTTPDVAVDALAGFLDTAFDGGRHQRRVEQLGALDRDESV